jgi:putative hydroxymethylpyrimidine transport system substrate-binding protein
MMKKGIIILLIIVSSITVYFIWKKAEAPHKLTIMLDWFPNVDHLPVYVAREQGYFSEKGLEVIILSPSDTSDGLKLAASGSVDIAISYQPQTIIAAAEGINIYAIGRLIEHPLTTLLFLKGKGIRKPSDLQGRKIGYTVPGLMDALLEAFARINGIKHYTPINVGFTIIPSLASGKVDAIMGPFKTYETVALELRGYQAGYFELEKWGIPDYDELIFVCGAKTLTEKEKAIKNFSRAIDRSIAYLRANPEKALEQYFKAVPQADKKTETEAFKLTLPYFSHSQQFNVRRWQRFADFSLKYGLVQNTVDVQSVIKVWEK